MLVFATPLVVTIWYAFGIASAAWIVYDTMRLNTPLPTALKWAWPILAIFFSVVGLGLYLCTSRPAGIGSVPEAERPRIFHRYAQSTFRKVAGSVSHCVGGDGLGIITAMVLARAWHFSFWQEFWFEYVTGFAFGWLIFQYKAMRAMADGPLQALAIAGRAEFFSMMTVMAGMGVVMAAVTPIVVGQQPPASTAAFWGFSVLGLFCGYMATWPMNWWLVTIGWKHGMR